MVIGNGHRARYRSSVTNNPSLVTGITDERPGLGSPLTARLSPLNTRQSNTTDNVKAKIDNVKAKIQDKEEY
jgi:hypothetical protein